MSHTEFQTLLRSDSTSRTDEIKAAATKLKGMGVRLMVVGIQNTADRATYSTLVTQPQKHYLINKADYTDLSVALYEMADTVCKGMLICNM